MNMDKFTVTIVGIILFFLAVFLYANNNVLVYAVKMMTIYVGITLTFLCITCILLVMASFKVEKRSTIIATFLPITFLFFTIMYNLLLTRSMPSINSSSPEKIPIDLGFIGLAFILVNGFLLSHILIIKSIDKTERLLLSTGLGFGATSLMMLLLGVIWEISISTLILAQATLFITTSIIALYKRFRQSTKEPKNPQKEKTRLKLNITLLETIILAITCTYTIIAIYQTAAYPAIEWDSLAYGLNYAKIIYENKKVPLIAGPSIGLEMSANYPPGGQLLAVYLYLFAGAPNDFYYRILQPIFGIAVMTVTYKLAILITKKRTVSLFSVLILIIIPVFWDNFVLETYLMNLTLMLTLSAYFFLKAYNTPKPDKEKYDLVGTLFCALSALVSYIGLLSLGILILYALYEKLSLKRLICLVALVSLIILPWYMRNFLLLGNPIYPFFGIGARLDPLLESSTVQHFQNWLKSPLFGSISIICKLVVCLLLLILTYFTLTKRNFTTTLTFYLLFISIAIMAFHIPFVRYLLVALPIFSIALSAAITSSISKQDLIEKSMAVTLIVLILISNINVIPFLNSAKPIYSANDKWDYLIQVFEDADAWKWISENTPQNATIATYDIREYYIERKVMLLDGYNAAPIYKMNTIEEAINYLKQQNVTHILSVTWASPMDARMPPAYKWCILTRYFGDSRYLPAVFVGHRGAAVYHVGPLEEESLYEVFSQENFVPPLKHLEINVTITNQTNPPTGRFYIPIPLDYREGLMITSTNSYGHLVSIELYNGIIPNNITTNWQGSFSLVKSWPPQSINTNSVENPSFVWEVDTAGYLTFLAVAGEQYEEGFNITVNIDFYNYWDKNTLFIKEGLETYNITIANNTYPLIKLLYIQVNEPSILSINCTTYGKKISIQICMDFIPNTAVMNWSEQYEIIRQQPNTNETIGEVNPSIQNMFLSYGKYTILIVYRDSYTEQNYILLNVTLTSLK